MIGIENLTRITEVFQDVFDNDTLKITKKTTAEDIDDWDSLMHITLISAIEAEFKVKFTLAEVMKMQSVGEMLEIIEQK